MTMVRWWAPVRLCLCNRRNHWSTPRATVRQCWLAQQRCLFRFHLFTCTDALVASHALTTVALGIGRLWVDEHHRRAGVATALVDCVRYQLVHVRLIQRCCGRDCFFYDRPVPRHHVAFSQPTPDGVKWMRQYANGKVLIYKMEWLLNGMNNGTSCPWVLTWIYNNWFTNPFLKKLKNGLGSKDV